MRVIIVISVLALAVIAVSAADDKECEVCVGVLDKLNAAKTSSHNSLEALEKLYKEECRKFTHPKEKRLCWYLGGAKDSATNILREVSRPMLNGVPSLNICRRLKTKDSAICSLRYTGPSVSDPPTDGSVPMKVDWDKVNKLKVKELRKILKSWGEECNGCVEKGDFIKRLKDLRPKHDPKKEL